ncbi:Uu.00g112120.m01.CDS01 [Anthostomella pinea]|uniref:Uu.00g112120.m01.CDS01 n=1 Tax=Anthostomella pinea TaxID=933095 RepID=A0AAI8VGA0_9PEZI|nr:Uu.00g112120.m01.CDS01 [Anthostomella pinea]
MPEDNPSTQTGKSESSLPKSVGDAAKDVQGFAAHKAHPGPAVPQSMPGQEGSKEERQAKAKELNK